MDAILNKIDGYRRVCTASSDENKISCDHATVYDEIANVCGGLNTEQ